jgi:AcrR family transcriptional regulator
MHEHLLIAARALFAENPDRSMDEIAAVAGVKIDCLRAYFSNIEQIREAVEHEQSIESVVA